MQDETLPEIFYSLLDRRVKAETITIELLEQYHTLTKDQPTFFSEILTLIGIENMLALIKSYGGVTLNIPAPSDILSTVRKNTNGTT